MFECGCAMNPFVLRRGDEWWLYYAGADAESRRRICLATMPAGDVTRITRRGVVLDLGAPGSFDARWVVLPHVVEVSPGVLHMYYTSNCGEGEGLSAFRGLGLTVSSDGVNWRRIGTEPVIAPSGVDGSPDAKGIAGGSVLKVRLPGGGSEWRFYYTGCPTVGKDIFLNQQKTVCYAVSQDAVRWEKRGVLMIRDPDRDYENVATAGPVVFQQADGTFRMWYSAIGTKWGFYSICYAESDDGLTWRRGERYGDNLQLGPHGDGWEQQMVEYPTLIEDGDRLRLFYCGDGYGRTGIGTALSVG